ncbi:hypothetical protein LCGC14_2700490, partial [marine sediment metagenome]
ADGLKLGVLDNNAADIFEYDMSADFDLSTATYNSISFLAGSEITFPTDIHINPTGTKLYLFSINNSNVVEYDFGTANALTSLSYNNVVQNISSIVSGGFSVQCIAFEFTDAENRLFFITAQTVNHIHSVELSSLDQNGTKMFISQCSSPAIFQFTLPFTTGDEGLPNPETYFRGGELRLRQNIISGLQCLNGEVVRIVADGNLEADQTVVNNTITIAGGRKVARAAIGLSYITDIETLNIEAATFLALYRTSRRRLRMSWFDSIKAGCLSLGLIALI